MPLMSKKRKTRWAFYINGYGKIQYNKYCRRCKNLCKQSFRAIIMQCPYYTPKDK